MTRRRLSRSVIATMTALSLAITPVVPAGTAIAATTNLVDYVAPSNDGMTVNGFSGPIGNQVWPGDMAFIGATPDGGYVNIAKGDYSHDTVIQVLDSDLHVLPGVTTTIDSMAIRNGAYNPKTGEFWYFQNKTNSFSSGPQLEAGIYKYTITTTGITGPQLVFQRPERMESTGYSSDDAWRNWAPSGLSFNNDYTKVAAIVKEDRNGGKNPHLWIFDAASGAQESDTNLPLPLDLYPELQGKQTRGGRPDDGDNLNEDFWGGGSGSGRAQRVIQALPDGNWLFYSHATLADKDQQPVEVNPLKITPAGEVSRIKNVTAPSAIEGDTINGFYVNSTDGDVVFFSRYYPEGSNDSSRADRQSRMYTYTYNGGAMTLAKPSGVMHNAPGIYGVGTKNGVLYAVTIGDHALHRFDIASGAETGTLDLSSVEDANRQVSWFNNGLLVTDDGIVVTSPQTNPNNKGDKSPGLIRIALSEAKDMYQPSYDEPSNSVTPETDAASATAEVHFADEVTGKKTDMAPKVTSFALGANPPEGASIDADTGTVTYAAPAGTPKGTVDVPVTVTYDDGSTDETTVTFTVAEKTTAQKVEPSYSATSVRPGATATAPVRFVDPTTGAAVNDVDVSSYALGAGAPDGVSISADGTVAYSAAGDATNSTITVPVIVNYADGSSDTAKAIIVVSVPETETSVTVSVQPPVTTTTTVTDTTVKVTVVEVPVVQKTTINEPVPTTVTTTLVSPVTTIKEIPTYILVPTVTEVPTIVRETTTETKTTVKTVPTVVVSTVKEPAPGTTVERLVPTTINKVVPTTVEKVVPTTVEKVVPTTVQTVVNKLVPTTVNKVVPTTVEKIVPTTVEKVVSTTVRQVVPTTVNKMVPTTVEKAVPTTVEKAVPTTVEKVIPTTVNNVVPTTVNQVVSTTVTHNVAAAPTTVTMTREPAPQEPGSAGADELSSNKEGSSDGAAGVAGLVAALGLIGVLVYAVPRLGNLSLLTIGGWAHLPLWFPIPGAPAPAGPCVTTSPTPVSNPAGQPADNNNQQCRRDDENKHNA